MNFDYLVKSAPMNLHWAGWETDTFRLQQNGWQLSAEQDPRIRTLRIAINHPDLCVQGITNVDRYDFERITHERQRFGRPVDIGLSVIQMGHKVYLNEHSHTAHTFEPIDAEPRMQEYRITSLSDLAHFTTIKRPQHEVFLKEASMEEILAMALQRQEPGQEAIRKRLIREQQMNEMRRYGELHTELRIVA